ncbi:MAG: hypothetical protein K6G45_08360 [Lachnospiraceae bacterium]|nr:hypothetical protein [Lachnospiraceae bacterium]
MKTCPYCKIEVGGIAEKCPLCQSRLSGEAENAYYPVHEEYRLRLLLYKIQRFVVLSIVIVGLGLDFLFGLRFNAFPVLHWSLILAMWLLIPEFLIIRQFRPGTGSARKVTMMVVLGIIMLVITAHYFDFLWLAWEWMVPIILSGMVIANFVLALFDKRGNTMAYLLTGLVFGLIPCIVIYFKFKKMPPAWMICTIISVILFAGTVIFKGRAMLKELQRRFNV